MRGFQFPEELIALAVPLMSLLNLTVYRKRMVRIIFSYMPFPVGLFSQKILISINFINQIFSGSESPKNRPGSKGPYWKDQTKT